MRELINQLAAFYLLADDEIEGFTAFCTQYVQEMLGTNDPDLVQQGADELSPAIVEQLFDQWLLDH